MACVWIDITAKKLQNKLVKMSKKWNASHPDNQVDIWNDFMTVDSHVFDERSNTLLEILKYLSHEHAESFYYELYAFVHMNESRSIQYPVGFKFNSEDMADYSKVAEYATVDVQTVMGYQNGCLISGYYTAVFNEVKAHWALAIWKFGSKIYLSSNCYGDVKCKLHFRRRFLVTPESLKLEFSEVRDKTGLLQRFTPEKEISRDMDIDVMQHYQQCVRREDLLIENFLINIVDNIVWSL